jgi:hypothetical protein
MRRHCFAFSLCLFALGLWPASTLRVEAQTCWVYTDSVNAELPIECVQRGDLSSACDWNDGVCMTPGDPEHLLHDEARCGGANHPEHA